MKMLSHFNWLSLLILNVVAWKLRQTGNLSVYQRIVDKIYCYKKSKLQTSLSGDLFRGTKDANRMLLFLDNIVDPDQYWALLNKIKTSNLFDKTVTPNGRQINIPDFFDNPTSAYQYYHKVEGNLSYFATIEGQEGVLIIIDKTGDYLISNIRGIIKAEVQIIYDEIKSNDD